MRKVVKLLGLVLRATLALLIIISLPTDRSAALVGCSEEKLRDLGVAVVNCSGQDACSVSTATVSAPASGIFDKNSDIYILGDSITNGAELKYRAVFPNAYINAVGGRSWISKGGGNPPKDAWWTDEAGGPQKGSDAVNAPGDVAALGRAKYIIIALGTNGGLPFNPIETMLDSIRLKNSTAPIFWVNTVITKSSSSTSSFPNTIATFNSTLIEKSTAPAPKNFKIINWHGTVQPGGDPIIPATTTDNDPNNYMSSDGIHPTGTGQGALVEAVLASLQGVVSTPSPSITNANSCQCTAANASAPGASRTVVLDPGHSNEDKSGLIDTVTGVDVGETVREYETAAVWDVATQARTALQALGYTVEFTKKNEADTYTSSGLTLKSRAETANGFQPSLVVAIHSTPGTVDQGNEVFYQKTDRGLFKEATNPLSGVRYLESTKPTNYDYVFTDTELETKSKAAAEILVQKMKAVGISNTVSLSDTANSTKGSMWVTQFFTKYPLIYAEVGAGNQENNLSADRRKLYANAIVETVKQYVTLTPVTPDQSASCGTPSTTPGNNNEEIAWNFLNDPTNGFGLQPFQAAGIMGGLKGESGNFETRQVEFPHAAKDGKPADPWKCSDFLPGCLSDTVPLCIAAKCRPGYGIAQWTAESRKAGLRQHAATMGFTVFDIRTQLGYMIVELKAMGLFDRIAATQTIEEATGIFVIEFEVPADKEQKAIERTALAIAILEKYQ